MRIWSLHPKYLDSKGLVALWRETLLAKNVLVGNTRGYRNHPQLDRFKEMKEPVNCINQYLSTVYEEAKNRHYNFNRDKIDWNFENMTIAVTTGQIKYEASHLLNKLKERDIEKYKKMINVDYIEPNPLFKLIEGQIEDWEII